MQKVAVFGNAGGGKSTLSRRLAALTNLPLVVLDHLQYQPGGEAVPHATFKAAHDRVLEQDEWIVDGFGSMDTVWDRLEQADTLVYVDLSLPRHYWWVTKRFFKGLIVPPEGWPEDSPLLKSTLNSFTTVWLCHTKLTPRYRAYVNQAQESKQVYHLQSPRAIKAFLAEMERHEGTPQAS